MQQIANQSGPARVKGSGLEASVGCAVAFGLTVGLSLSACRAEPGGLEGPTPAPPTAAPAAPGAVGAYATVGATPRSPSFPKALSEPPSGLVPSDAGAAVPIEDPKPSGIPL